jgi:phosphatidylinositol alpha-1,6-mannosyltransferase
MKVILISQDFYPITGGIATYLLQIYRNYFNLEDFSVIVPENISKREDYKKFNFKVDRVRFSPFESPTKRKKENKRLLGILKNEKPDLILFGYLRSHSEIGEAYKKINPKCKYGIVLHAKEAFLDSSITKNTNNNGKQKGYTEEEVVHYKKILNQSDFLITVSRFTKRLLKEQGIKNRFFIINPLLDEIPNLKFKSTSNKEFNLLSVGRLIKRKGQDSVIEILNELKNKIPNIKYFIVGEGVEKNNLIKLVKKEKLDKIVTFVGNVDNKRLKKYYWNCDLFILPTKHILPNDVEGFGIVFLEAGSYSKPVIGGKNGGVVEAIKNGKTGYLIKERDKKELIKKILYLYENQKERERLGKNGRKRIEQEFYKNKNKSFVNYLNKIKKDSK